jgi:hypothetical protein
MLVIILFVSLIQLDFEKSNVKLQFIFKYTKFLSYFLLLFGKIRNKNVDM